MHIVSFNFLIINPFIYKDNEETEAYWSEVTCLLLGAGGRAWTEAQVYYRMLNPYPFISKA